MSRKRYPALILLGLGTMFRIVMLTNPVGDWCANYLAEINLDIMCVDRLGHLTQVSYLAMFGLWTMFFLLMIRLCFRYSVPTRITKTCPDRVGVMLDRTGNAWYPLPVFWYSANTRY